MLIFYTQKPNAGFYLIRPTRFPRNSLQIAIGDRTGEDDGVTFEAAESAIFVNPFIYTFIASAIMSIIIIKCL